MDQNKRKKLMLLFGGVSSEHEVSRTSAASVLEHIDTDKYELIKVGITKGGRWMRTDADSEAIADGSWENLEANDDVYLLPGGGFAGLDVDVVFPLLHGRNGEDGRMQGFLAIAGIPFVGSDSTSSAACMDKAITKAVIDQAEVFEQAKCCIAHKGCDEEESAVVIGDFFEGRFPLFVKPANAGSSVGITKVKTLKELPEALRVAFAEDTKAIVEETIVGREIEVAVLGNDDPQASCIGEIISANEFYDYVAKYDDVGSETSIVTDLPYTLEDQIRETAVQIFQIMGCRGLARVDFFLRKGPSGTYDDGELVFNEINTMPGFTKISMYPQLWGESGIPYGELIDRLIGLASEEE
ncbi:MAG: D-alanine--D-alanine ligase [Firmicutes bacterium]|nr:D-alanine--D-alanine ligase [Bacillota bacterium]